MKNSNLIEVETYLESGIQIGTKFKTKDMSEYIHKVNPQNGVAILDIQKIDEKLKNGIKFLSQYNPEDILVVCRRERMDGNLQKDLLNQLEQNTMWVDIRQEL